MGQRGSVKQVAVTGAFDNFGSRDVRFLEEASKLGDLRVLLWSDVAIGRLEGLRPKLPERERLYLLEAIRYVRDVQFVDDVFGPENLPSVHAKPLEIFVSSEASDTPARRDWAEALGLDYVVLKEQDTRGFKLPLFEPLPRLEGHKKVVVTGCFDWFHSGHVRFFEEAAGLGELYVVVGHDANIRLLKGEAHPLFSQDERRYLVNAVRHVSRALISSGHGWMDAEPEIALIQPDVYFVNEDGDKPEKRAFCHSHGIEFVVSKRIPRFGLPRRQSTELRGF